MKRTDKNIIMILALLLIIGAAIFTIVFAKKNLKPSLTDDSITQLEENGSGAATPPEMPDNANGQNQGQQPPEMPDGSSNGSNMSTPPEMPSGSTTDTNTPPEMPSGSTADTNTPPEMPSGSTADTNTPPEMPSGSTTDTNTPPQMPGGTNQNNMNMSSPNIGAATETVTKTVYAKLTAAYYVLFVVESLCISLLILYLIMSGFNKYNIKQTLAVPARAIIFALGVVIVTGLLTAGEVLLENKVLLKTEQKTVISQNPQGFGGNMSSVTYSSANELTKNTEVSGEAYSSDKADENALTADGEITATVSDTTITKTGDSDGGDTTSFYGTNSAVIAKSGANLTLKNITVNTDATGANGVFSYGGSATTNNSSTDKTTITISDSKITTTKDNSGGLMTTGGGIMNAYNLEINTAGTSSAAIRSDRGGGTVTVDGGTYTTTGLGSPAVYSTADITVKNADLISNLSEGIIIEGKNSVAIENTKVTDSNTKLNGLSTTYKNIFLYQSMSGDADNGIAEFSAKDSTIITKSGDTFYITNTTAQIDLENNKITNTDSNGCFLRAQKDSWGNSGNNGGNVTLNVKNQETQGDIIIDSISTLTMTMTSASYNGTINGDNSAKSITLTLDKASKLTLTGDSYVTSIQDEDTSYSNIDFNGYKLYVNGVSIK